MGLIEGLLKSTCPPKSDICNSMGRKKKKEEKPKIVHRLRNKYRLVIFNDDTFEEKVSIILSPINVFTWGGLLIMLLIVIIVSMIAFTPLREAIPGYADVDTRLRATYAALKADSLHLVVQSKERYMSNLQAILKGEPVNMEMIGRKL